MQKHRGPTGDPELQRNGIWARSSVSTLSAVLATTALLLGGCDGEADPEPSYSAPTDQVTAMPPAEASAADGGTLRLAEQGFSQTPDETGNGIVWVSVGFVVENTSRTEVAIAPEMTVELLDSDGQRIPIESPAGEVASMCTYPIMPGGNAGIGAVFAILDAEVATVAAQVNQANWLPPDNTFYPVSEVSVSDVTVHWDDDPELVTFSFTVKNGYDAELIGPNIHWIFRDESGQIVGGGSSRYDANEWVFAVGSSVASQQITVDGGIPAQAEPTRTEVYVAAGGC